jgi:hypothetical protein
MGNRVSLSPQTRRNWLIAAALSLSGIAAVVSGVYFLFLPSGGYQGGRNPMYGVTILFDRHTWDAVHTWGGLAMIAVAALHLALHGPWMRMTGRRIVKAMASRSQGLPHGVRRNIALNVLVAASGLVTAVTGLVLLFAPAGHASGLAVAWDLAHTWSGVVMTVAAAAHLAIHWRWITSVTRRLATPGRTMPQPSGLPAKS